MKKIILIILAIICVFLTPWLFLVPDWFAENIGGLEEIYTLSSVVTFFAAIVLLNASHNKGAKPCR